MLIELTLFTSFVEGANYLENIKSILQEGKVLCSILVLNVCVCDALDTQSRYTDILSFWDVNQQNCNYHSDSDNTGATNMVENP